MSETRADSVSRSEHRAAGVGAETASPSQATQAPGEHSSRRDTVSASPLAAAFGRSHPALVTYLMAGYPTRAASLDALLAAAEAGADIIELGAPYTDQLADGPVIVSASTAAREAAGGAFGLAETLDLAREFVERAGDGAPALVLMCYLNPVLRMGLEIAADAIAAAGISGVIVPDLPPDLADEWIAAVDGRFATVFLAAPTSTPERLALVGSRSTGFVYCVSTTGITGERDRLAEGISATVARVREHTALPVAVGFGVSTPEQAAAVAAIADGVIVGSAVVRRQGDVEELRAFVSELSAAVHGTGESR